MKVLLQNNNICPYFEKGNCRKGEDCPMLHPEKQQKQQKQQK